MHAYHLVTLNDNFAGHAHAASQLRAALHALLPAVVVTDMETGHAYPQWPDRPWPAAARCRAALAAWRGGRAPPRGASGGWLVARRE